MAPQKKRQGGSEYARKKDIHERIGVLEEAAKHAATREWVLWTLFKVFGAVIGGALVVWRLFG